MSTNQIIEFASRYTKEVVEVVSEVLRHQKVISDSVELVDDEDLYRIPEIYTGRSRFWLCLIDERVTGTVAIREMSDSTARLNRMFVLASYHGQGVGQQLLEHALHFARRGGYSEMILNTHPLMKRAHRFYERNGFIRVAEESDTYHYQRQL